MSNDTTPQTGAFSAWWRSISVEGEPIRKPPKIVSDAFAAGWEACAQSMGHTARIALARIMEDQHDR